MNRCYGEQVIADCSREEDRRAALAEGFDAWCIENRQEVVDSLWRKYRTNLALSWDYVTDSVAGATDEQKQRILGLADKATPEAVALMGQHFNDLINDGFDAYVNANLAAEQKRLWEMERQYEN